MARKLLTALDQIVARTAITQATVARSAEAWATARLVAQRTATVTVQKTTLQFVNVQALMLGMRLLSLGQLLPLLTPRQMLRQIAVLEMPLMEERELFTRRKMSLRQMQELRTSRTRIMRPQKVRQTLREIMLSRTAITMTDQLEFALLEKYLWVNMQAQVEQVLQKILHMCIAKQWYCESITGLESLIQLMLQMYVYAFMMHPQTAVMLAMRVTPLTMQVLRHKLASIYMVCAVQNQALAPKGILITAQKRKTRTKAVSESKGKTEMVNIKQNIGQTKDLTDGTKVGVGRDAMGKEMFFTTLRYAYSMPFWLRRWFARQFGMPENHKYARYFGIGCIPSRYAKRSWKRYRKTEPAITNFNRDQYLKRVKKFREMHGTGVPQKGVYGGFGAWLREYVSRGFTD